MIIDDDKGIRERLTDSIEWEKLNLQLVCEASDSDTARELYLLYRPRIIITDIKIPIISGLELAEQLAMIDDQIRFIVITGYNDFHYAQQSVKIGAIDLLLKPILPQTINDSLKKAVCYFERKKNEIASISALQTLISENLPVLQEKCLMNLLNEKPKNAVEVELRLQKLGVKFEGTQFAVVILSMESVYDLEHSQEAVGMLLSKTLSKMFRSMRFDVTSFFDSHFRLNCVANWEFQNGDDLLEEALNKVASQLLFTVGCKVYAGIGRTVDHPADLYLSGKEAKMALNYQGIFREGTIIHYKNIQHYNDLAAAKDSIWTFLTERFRANDYHSISEAIGNHLQGLFKESHDSERQLRDFIFQYVAMIVSEGIKMGAHMEEIESYADIMNRLFVKADTSLQLSYVLELTKRILNSISETQKNCNNYLITKAKKFISENLQDEALSLDRVGNNIGLSRVYFCKLFHKEIGVPFNAYLNQVRVDRAKQLLKQTTLKLPEISEKTGFANAKYFGYVFKKVAGMTPLEYQRQETGKE